MSIAKDETEPGMRHIDDDACSHCEISWLVLLHAKVREKREVPNSVRTNCYISICLLVLNLWGSLHSEHAVLL